MPDEKAKKQAGRAKAQANRDTAVVRRADAAHFPGSSVHASLASEIGLRIVRGDYPPGTILPNEAKWSETFSVSRSAVREAIKMLMAKSLLA
ncbi:FadR family transcriptional regulator, partial [Mesorhizobium sp. M2D.F.Ca.ET.145.01.1.1]